MEEMLKSEIIKLKAGEIYVEVGVNKKTLSFVHRLRKDIDIYGVDEIDDPCVAGTYHLQGKSKDVADVWFMESGGSLISVLLINCNYNENYEIWSSFVKRNGVIIDGTLAHKT